MSEVGHVNVCFDVDLTSQPSSSSIDEPSMTRVLNLRNRMNMTNSVLSHDVYSYWLDENFCRLFMDHDENGVPTEKLLTLLRNDCYGINRQKLNRFMKKLDGNKDGKITYSEFKEYMLNVEPSERSFVKQVLISLAVKTCPDLVNSYLPEYSDVNCNIDEERHKLQNELAETYIDNYSCHPPPVFIPFILVAQITTFIIYGLQIIKENDPDNKLTLTTGLPRNSPLIFDMGKRKEVWRFFTYMLIHQGYLHLVFNCLIQLLLGIPLEMVNKFWRVGPVFMGGVLFGSLASSIMDKSVFLVGSSGGSYALIGAHLAIVIMNWDELQRDWLNCKQSNSMCVFMGSGVMRLFMLTVFLTTDVAVTLYRRLGPDRVPVERTSVAAHVGGLIAGLLIGIPCLRNIRKKLWEVKLFWISLTVYTMLLTFAILWNIFYPELQNL